MKKIILVSLLTILLASCGTLNEKKTNGLTEVRNPEIVKDTNIRKEEEKESTIEETTTLGGLLEENTSIQDNIEKGDLPGIDKKLEAKMEKERLAMEKEQEAKMEKERLAMEAQVEAEAKAMEDEMQKELEANINN